MSELKTKKTKAVSSSLSESQAHLFFHPLSRALIIILFIPLITSMNDF